MCSKKSLKRSRDVLENITMEEFSLGGFIFPKVQSYDIIWTDWTRHVFNNVIELTRSIYTNEPKHCDHSQMKQKKWISL